jgi:FkbM family methyltransferase
MRRFAKEHTRWITIAWHRCVATVGLSALAPDRRGRFRILGALPRLTAARCTGRSIEVQLPLQAARRPVRLFVGDPSELEALYEVVVEDEYKLPHGLEPRVVLDLGSHIGASVIVLRLAYPNARIVAVEPDPRSFSRLTRNVAMFSDITCLNLAVGPKAGRQPLYRQAGASWGTSLLPFGGRQEGPQVEVCAVDEIVARANTPVAKVGLVKFDIEGSEWDIFPALARLPTVDLLVGEIHFSQGGRDDFDAVRRALPGFHLEILRADKYGGVIHAFRSADY